MDKIQSITRVIPIETTDLSKSPKTLQKIENNTFEGESSIVNMWGVCDGDPKNYGVKLAKLVKNIKLSSNQMAGCLSAQIVSHFKTDKSNYFLMTPERTRYVMANTNFDYYIYTVYVIGTRTQLKKYLQHEEGIIMCIDSRLKQNESIKYIENTSIGRLGYTYRQSQHKVYLNTEEIIEKYEN